MTNLTGVSVVIPVFNREALIESALESVRTQTYRPLQITVVDDGSTDGTVEVVKNWASANNEGSLTVRCLVQENLGANAARNRGVSESTFPIIVFLDSDDRWLPDKVEKQQQLLLSQKDLGGVYCGLHTIDLASGEIHPLNDRAYATGDLLSKMLIQDVTNPTSCWMVRKNCFEEVGGFDTSLPARQDWDMWIRLCSKYHIGCVPEVLVEMGEHTGERVRSDPEREISAHKTIYKKYAYLRAELPYSVSLATRSAMYRRRGRVYLHRKHARLKAAGCQLMAIGTWPFNFDSYAALLGVLLPGGFRSKLHVLWNHIFGKTKFGIRSH